MHYFYIFLVSIFLLGCGGGGGSGTLFDGGNNTLFDEPNDTAIVSAPSTTGETPMLVVRLEYNNQTFINNAFTWSNKIFASDAGSMNDYYSEVSYNKFSFSRANETEDNVNDGVITIKLNRDHPNSSIDSTSFSSKVYPDLIDGLSAADAYIDFNAYDSNSDGTLTSDELTIMYVFAGYEDAYAGSHVTNGIWAHMDSINTSLTLDGVSLLQAPSNYALFGERHAPTSSSDPIAEHDATIGIIAHELGHARFDLPDLYDTQGSGFGIGNFGYMGGGSWGQVSTSSYPGASPVHPTAWTKIKNGWIAPQTTSGTINFMESASNSFNIHKRTVSGSGNTEVYYLYENRNNSGYDQGLYTLEGTFGGGLAIWRIDENTIAAGKTVNEVNTGNSQGIKLMIASSERTINKSPGHEKNLFYNGNVNTFTPGDIDVTNISTRGSSMSATIN